MKTYGDSSDLIFIWKRCSCCCSSIYGVPESVSLSQCLFYVVCGAEYEQTTVSVFCITIPFIFFWLYMAVWSNVPCLGILLLRQKEPTGLFYIGSSVSVVTGIEIQHGKVIIGRIKGIFNSQPQSFCCFLRNAAIIMCTANLSCFLWANSSLLTAHSACCGVKRAC